MSENLDKEIKGHDYDGITEYDNPLPTWWLTAFFATIIFGAIYYLHYEIAGGPTLKQELAAAMKEIEAHKSAAAPVIAETEADVEAATKDDQVVKLGAATFEGKCAACHGAQLQGMIGPNLTDKYWIHGKGTRLDMLKVIREGVADKGMPPWGALLKREEQYAVVAYVLSKKGSNPPNPKAPQGELVKDY